MQCLGEIEYEEEEVVYFMYYIIYSGLQNKMKIINIKI